MVIRCIIVDDEPPARDEWRYLLSRMPDVEVVASASSATQALEAIHHHVPDLVFLDIEMPGGNGFSVVEQLMDMDTPPLVIFATAFDQYAIRAFEENAIDYILKPLEESRVRKGLEKARQRLGSRDTADDASEAVGQAAAEQRDVARLLERIGQRAPFTRLSVESHGRMLLLQPDEVCFCRADEKKVWVHTRSERFVCHGSANLGRLEERLMPYDFFRANRAELVNLATVREFAPWDGGRYTLCMDDAADTEIVVNRSRVREFKERLGLL